MRVLAALLFLISLAPPPAVEAQDPGPVVFSELMWMGSEASSADEWIELYNRGSQSIDLSGWTITRVGSDGTEGVMLTVEAGSIGVGETFLIANYKPDSDRSRLATTVQFVSTAVALPNTKLMLRLYDAPEGGTLIDVADDGTGRPLGGVTEPPSFDWFGRSSNCQGHGLKRGRRLLSREAGVRMPQRREPPVHFLLGCSLLPMLAPPVYQL
jgi:hypothetical protein